MIIQFLLSIPVFLLQGFNSIFPDASVLPFGIDSIFVQGMGYIRFIMEVFPPLQSMYNGLVWYIGFILLLKVIAMIPILKGLLHK